MTEEQFKALEKVSDVCMEYLEKYGTPHTTLIATMDFIKQVDDTICVPLNKG